MVTSTDRQKQFDSEMERYFAQLYAQHRPELLRYVTTFVPNHADADEVLQETSVVTWSKFDQFQRGSNFVAWAKQIAYYEVLKFRRRRKDSLLQLSDQALATLAAESDAMWEELNAECRKLESCVDRLSPRDRQIIRLRYLEGGSARHVSEHLRRPLNTVFKSLRRIRSQLLRCMTRNSIQEQHDELG